MPFNLPIALTWLRVAAIPLLVGIFYLPNDWLSLTEKNILSTGLFVFAAITEGADCQSEGIAATKFGLGTRW